MCAGLLGVGLVAAAPARATLTVDLVWIATTGSGTPGSSTIEAEPGDELTLEVAIIVDAAGVESYSLSVEFDPGFTDELDIVSTVEFDEVPTAQCTPFPSCFVQPALESFNMGVDAEIESTRLQSGMVQGFEAFTAAPDGPVSFRSPIGEIVFVVTDRVDRHTEGLEGSILTVIDGYLDNSLNFVGIDDLPDPAFVPGFAPEPGAGLLALAAGATLATLRNRTRNRDRNRD